jgi:hypothetical protein
MERRGDVVDIPGLLQDGIFRGVSRRGIIHDEDREDFVQRQGLLLAEIETRSA